MHDKYISGVPSHKLLKCLIYTSYSYYLIVTSVSAPLQVRNAQSI